ncbi:MAG: hypothetical protein GY858_06975 [Candidatus Omnitrophica bacterium]|nr:hypothetical protein [Candidatus Omnitrophota bacterium]
MAKFILVLTMVILIPLSGFCGNTASFSICIRVPDISELRSDTEKEETATLNEEVTEIASKITTSNIEVVEEEIREGNRTLVKTTYPK